MSTYRAAAVRHAFTASAFVFCFYVWLYNRTEHSTHYYEHLSRAFLNGQVSLLNSVSCDTVGLSNIPDPYDPALHGGSCGQLHDVAFYKGNIYLAWGPVPGLLLAALHTVREHATGDHSLTVIFLSGLLLFNALLLIWAKRRLFPDLSDWQVLLGVFLVGLSHPLPWLLGRPTIYEASVAAGQFFLVAGIYWGFSAISKERPAVWEMGLAGFSLALAAGSRNSLSLAVIFFSLALTWSIWIRRSQLGWYHVNASIAALALPLIVGTSLLLLYNYIRFDSVFEFGQRFQLAGVNQHALFQNKQAFSSAYVLPNLMHYFVFPFRIVFGTPFLVPLQSYSQPVADLYIPNLVFEHITGVIWGTPFTCFALLSILAILLPTNRYTPDAVSVLDDVFEKRVLRILSVVILLCVLPLLPFYGGAMRYLSDFTPALVILSILGYWTFLRRCRYRRSAYRFFLSVSVAVSLLTFFVGVYFGIFSAYLQSLLYG